MIAVTQFAVESLQYAGGHTSAASEFLTAIFGQAKEDLKTAGSTVSLPNLRF